MPTGYTADIRDYSFKEFVLNCSRAFGALVDIKEEPNTKIPVAFKPKTSFYKDHLLEAKTESDNLLSLTNREIDELYKEEYSKECFKYNKAKKDRKELNLSYEIMLNKVKCWTEPTKDHKELKAFMENQLEISIDSDCSTEYLAKPVKISSKEWLRDKIKTLNEDIHYYNKSIKKEIEITDKRNLWLKQLRESL